MARGLDKPLAQKSLATVRPLVKCNFYVLLNSFDRLAHHAYVNRVTTVQTIDFS
jgi:hypothetical protein